MATVLYLNASMGGERSHSKRLAAEFLADWRESYPADTIVIRDLAVQPPPLIDEHFVTGLYKGAADHTPAEAQIFGVSDAYVDEMLAADYVVMAAPVYNYTLPTPLKAYIDLLFRVGRTLESTPQGLRGLLTGKQVLVVSARLGDYAAGTGREHFDYHEPYMRFILERLGMTDVTYVAASQNPMIHDEPTREAQMATYRERLRDVRAAWATQRGSGERQLATAGQ